MADNEMYVTYISYMMPIAEILIGGCCFYLLAKAFMENKKEAVSVGATYFLTMLILYLIPLYFTNFIAYCIGCFAAFLVMCRIDRRNYEQKAFIAVAFFSLHWFVYAMTDILHDKCYSLALKTDYMAEHSDMWFVLYVVMCMFWLMLELLLMALSIGYILKNYEYKYVEMSKKELLILIVPSVMGVLGFESMWYYRSSYIAESGKTSDIYDALAIFYCAAAVISIVVVIVLYQRIRAQQEEKLQNELLATQMDSIRQHIEQVEDLYQNIRSIKHDMTNHIITLERLYAGNKVEEAKAYSTDLKAVLDEVTGKVNSGNPVTDIILQEMQSEAVKRKIRFDSDFHYPTGSNVNVFDVSVILNNALQNALENAEKSETPYISIFSYRRYNAYMIEINNSFTGDLQWDTEKVLPITSKGKADGHGYGLINIRRMAVKYSGDIDIVLKDGEFRLSIMLMLE